MPKVVGIRERRHQPYYDTLIRQSAGTSATPTVQTSTQLFNGTNLGLEQWTNMSVPGMFASDNSYIALSLRCYVQYIGNFAPDMYALTMQQLYLQFTVADKPQFSGPCWYFPQGGGVWGMNAAADAMSNGTPQTDAILKFAKPIPIPARQHLKVVANLYDTDSVSLRHDYLNQMIKDSVPMCAREIKVMIDGLHTRDVL
jgi:hypothetical protein